MTGESCPPECSEDWKLKFPLLMMKIPLEMMEIDIQHQAWECGNLRRPHSYGHIKQKVFVSVNVGGILMAKVFWKLFKKQLKSPRPSAVQSIHLMFIGNVSHTHEHMGVFWSSKVPYYDTWLLVHSDQSLLHACVEAFVGSFGGSFLGHRKCVIMTLFWSSQAPYYES